MAETVKILFVDDEPAIRASLPAILRMHGFDVTSAADVAEAVQAIAAQKFDVLVSDLNIGSPGDGFTVVSAMRRTQPNCVTLILTGYPAFETALQAIRSQVDDYLIKPAGVEQLVASIESKLRDRKPRQLDTFKRVAQILNEHQGEVLDRIMNAEQRILELPGIQLTQAECRNSAESLLQRLTTQMISGGPDLLPSLLKWSQEYARSRYQQGYSADLLVDENRIFCAAILDCVHENLLSVELSYLLPDLKLLSMTLNLLLREAVATHGSMRQAA